MKTLVVAATIEELSGFYAHFNLPKEPFVQTARFDVLITGVGMTATAFALGQHLTKDYVQVLNLGIAGAFDRTIPLGSLVNVYEDLFAELGAEDGEKFISIEELGFGKSKYTCKPNGKSPKLDALKAIQGITVNTVHGNTDNITRLLNRVTATTESMEGAAVFYACEQIQIPCFQVRSISNYVEKRNRESWKIGLAIKNLNDWAIDFLTST